ncbi:MAG: NYN domain-containing protein [Chloroflexi bacterium]|nr:NYN domain-containing protein [Chloroflexota bacterium]
MPIATTHPSSRQDERVMIFIDGSNLYHVLGQTCGRHDLQFDKFAQKLANGRDLRRVYYYNIRQEAFEDRSNAADQDKFLASLYDTPYLEVKLGIWKQRGATMVEKGVDVMLAVDLVTHAYADHYDSAIIVSGDADFYPALQAVKNFGKHVEVAAFDQNISSEASRVADLHIRLTKTFFTGLWTTRTQQRERGEALRRPEVSDEAASPNGEDKAATKAATSSTARRSTRTGRTGTRRPISRTGSRSSATETANGASPEKVAATPAAAERPTAPERREPAQSAPATAAAPSAKEEATERPNIRRTPSRRRVGGTASSAPADAASSSSARPRPPALRTPANGSSNGSSGGGEPQPASSGASAGADRAESDS